MDTRLLTKLTVDSKIGVSSVSSKSKSVSIIPWICLALAKYLRSLSGTKRHLLRKLALERFVCLQRGQERLCCCWGCWASESRQCWGLAKVRNDLVPSLLRIPSRREGRAWDILGFMEANFRTFSSVPYRCFTSWGSHGFVNRSHVRTMRFSTVRDISTSSSRFTPWWVIPPRLIKLSSMKANSLW